MSSPPRKYYPVIPWTDCDGRRVMTPRQIEQTLAGTPDAISAEEVDPLIQSIVEKIRAEIEDMDDVEVTTEEVIAQIAEYYARERNK